jgi:hypothetical protein
MQLAIIATGWVEAAQNFHESRLASPILTDQSMNFAFEEIKIDTSKSFDSGKFFFDIQHG